MRGGVWAAVETWGLQVVQFVLFLVLARQLGPEVYGLIAIAMTINVIGEALIVEGGWVEVIVQRQNLDRRHLDSAFRALLMTGFALALVACAGAPILAAVFSEPALLALVPALSVALPIRSLGIVPEAILSRELRFRPLAVRSVVATLGAGVVAVALALAGAGVWSLVVNQILQPLIGFVLVWRAVPYRPRDGISRRHLRELLPFVGARLFERLLVAADSLLPRLAIGYLLGAVALGHYTLARKVVELATQLLVRPFIRVGMSSLSAVAGQREKLQSAVGKLVSLATALAAPALAGLALVAPEFVLVTFGAEWLPAVPAIAVLGLLGVTLPASRILTTLLFATGQPGVQVRITAPGLLLLLGLFVFVLPASLEIAAGLIVLRHALMMPWQVVLTRRATGVDTLAALLRSVPSIGAVAVMTAGVLAVRALPVIAESGPLVTFAGSVVAGIVLYALALLLFARPLVTEFAGLAGSLRSRPEG